VQLEDLAKGAGELLESIQEIERESQRSSMRLRACCRPVLQQMYGRLFSGGQADWQTDPPTWGEPGI